MIRNKEVRQFTVLFCFIAVLAVALGFGISIAAGILAVASAAAFGTTFFMFTKARYQNIAQLSEEIDLVLHDAGQLIICESEEGELSILQSEITKMILRIREQNNALKKEKEHLADSLADIAHQLRTPLTSVNLILSLLENSPDEQQQRNLIRDAKELFVQTDWLLNSLLKLSRLDAGIVVFKREQIEVNRFIRASFRPLLISLDLHNITLQTDIPEGIQIQGDSGWLSEALQNILKNCMESTGDNGIIKISCTDNPLFTEILIHDNGKGFEKKDLRFLFERFYRGNNENATGYGIGLALCRTIITRQGGTVKAKNHPKGGALFTIRFPK